ncbi:maleylpyruvate isomerase N-terminal domain-containing protein [Arthrobacter sp. I2-34]|uniref:Maleylpyruvate isomerase N-terminal domain-containing protein n=1 Tax=Arthrobacter hankyongi TaxID=2904801 RepID=A0ABS9L158_9MICC|nr:maleylpyruvate isomerase N-terminal domain-containing protein [Arthrobacter hankyongi]MCG2620427.1 maleylpyruvate isomerase N-terminal domain-containing protein [Arthrobacter hankyongi]
MPLPGPGLATYLHWLGSAAGRLEANARQAGLEAPVPTCPGWTVRDLLVHQGMVHRWATANIAGSAAAGLPAGLAADEVARRAEAAGYAAADLPGWFRSGSDALAAALAGAPADLAAMVFLRDAPAPREFWARRQAHETAIHAVDALAAVLGRTPLADESGIGPAQALDGVDELLCGFLPRRRTQLRTEGPVLVHIRAVDGPGPDTGSGPSAWNVQLGQEPPRTERAAAVPDRADAIISAAPAALYLGLWNRGGELEAGGDAGVLQLWRQQMRVSWS